MKRKTEFVSSHSMVRAFWHKASDAQVATSSWYRRLRTMSWLSLSVDYGTVMLGVPHGAHGIGLAVVVNQSGQASRC